MSDHLLKSIIAASPLRLGIFLAVAAGISGCAAGSERFKSPPPIPGIDRVKSVTVLPIRFVLMPTRFSKPEAESTVVSFRSRAERFLKREIERIVSRSQFGLRRLDTDDSTLQSKPGLSWLARVHVDQPDRALLRTIASPDAPTSRAPQTIPMDIVDFAVDSTGAQYLLFVQGSGSYSVGPRRKYILEKMPAYSGGNTAVGILKAIGSLILGGGPSDLEESAVETDFFLEARLVDVGDRQILWHNSVSYEKRILEDGGSFDPRTGEDLRIACERLMRPLLEAGPLR